jgi:hypothetical protein
MHGKAYFERDGSREPIVIVFALLAFLGVGLWEVFAMHGSYVGGWLRTPFVDDPWTPDTAPFCLSAPFVKVRENLELLPVVGGILLNSQSLENAAVGITLCVSGTLLIALGLYLALPPRLTVTPLYVLIFVLVATAHMVFTGENDNYRLLVPVVPFLFYYAIDGARHLGEYAARGAAKNWLAISLQAAGIVYVLWFVGLGLRHATRGVYEAHASPFGSYPIKRPWNYDAQRIALWLKAHSQPQDRYASTQRDMFDVLTERRGLEIGLGRVKTSDSFLAWLDEHQVRYVLVDHTMPVIRDSLLGAIHANPQRFRSLLQLSRASLYEVQPRAK